MEALWVEVEHPKFGLERYKIKVITKYNVPTNTLSPVPKKRAKPEQISCLWVGRGVSEKEIMDYVVDHFKRTGLWERILRMQVV
jgi:hypothetical protein